MEEDKRDESLRLLEKLRQDLQLMSSGVGRLGLRSADPPYAAELEYHPSRISTALSGLHSAGFSFRMSSYRDGPELLAQIDALLAQTKDIHTMAEHAREVLLRPPPEKDPDKDAE
jgi:hypothetical protein